MKETFATTVRVRGRGDTKAKACSDALSQVQGTVLKSTNRILLRIEPQDVQVVQAQLKVRNEAFLFFFLKRERKSYSVELDVSVNVTALNLDEVDFVSN